MVSLGLFDLLNFFIYFSSEINERDSETITKKNVMDFLNTGLSSKCFLYLILRENNAHGKESCARFDLMGTAETHVFMNFSACPVLLDRINKFNRTNIVRSIHPPQVVLTRRENWHLE